MIAVIQAGGKGTRLTSVTNDLIPKPMVMIQGKPLLQWQIEMLHNNGIKKIILIIGHLGFVIKEYFGDGSKFGVAINYIEENEPLGTAGALYFLKDHIKNEDFILIYGDVFFDINIKRMIDYHNVKKGKATLFVHPNTHPYDSDLIILNEDGRIKGFDSKNNIRTYWYDNCVNAGVFILSFESLISVTTPSKLDLEKDILFPLVEKGEDIYGYQSTEYVKDVGTVERLKEVEKDIISGYIRKRNLKNPQKCIFIDRDGTINKHKGLIYKEEDFLLEENVIEAIKLINTSGYLAIVITNQSVVARGLCSLEDVNVIHKKMATLLGEQGAYLDDIQFCPHHPDGGYPEENREYKIVCRCRKPKIGMIEEFVDKYNIDLANSWVVGDTTVDIQTGINAGTKTALVLTGEAGEDRKYDVKPNLVGNNLFDIVQKILDNDD